jgi:DNA adenine methylase
MNLPQKAKRICVPPIKCQGIKTKLVPFIMENINWDGKGRWIEPFVGSGVVLFNVQPEKAIANDINFHVINFYKGIQDGLITPNIVKEFLVIEGKKLLENGETNGKSYYYEVRERFNKSGNPLDFLFLSRSCFNGVMRFNAKGKFNVPFCHKPERFRPAYITKIVNQIKNVSKILYSKEWTFTSTDWRKCLQEAQPSDFVYLDPPYIGRSVDYYNLWTQKDADELAEITQSLPCGFALSMWKENKYRKNDHIDKKWGGNVIRTLNHFYHVGSTESLRNEMIEALVIKKGFESNYKKTKNTQSELFDIKDFRSEQIL